MSIIMSMMRRHLSPKTSLATGERQMYLQVLETGVDFVANR